MIHENPFNVKLFFSRAASHLYASGFHILLLKFLCCFSAGFLLFKLTHIHYIGR